MSLESGRNATCVSFHYRKVSIVRLEIWYIVHEYISFWMYVCCTCTCMYMYLVYYLHVNWYVECLARKNLLQRESITSCIVHMKEELRQLYMYMHYSTIHFSPLLVWRDWGRELRQGLSPNTTHPLSFHPPSSGMSLAWHMASPQTEDLPCVKDNMQPMYMVNLSIAYTMHSISDRKTYIVATT